jgi:hypothetical protein
MQHLYILDKHTIVDMCFRKQGLLIAYLIAGFAFDAIFLLEIHYGKSNQ